MEQSALRTWVSWSYRHDLKNLVNQTPIFVDKISCGDVADNCIEIHSWTMYVLVKAFGMVTIKAGQNWVRNDQYMKSDKTINSQWYCYEHQYFGITVTS